MSQYQDYFFSDHENSNHQFLLNSPVFHSERYGVQLWGELNQPQKIAETVQTYCYTEFTQNLEIKPSFSHSLPQKNDERSKSQIICQEQVLQKHSYILRGFKNDTVLLNVNFKTIIFNYLKDLLSARQLGEQQKSSILEFKKEVASFLSVSRMMRNCKIKQKCKSLIQSPLIIRIIFLSKMEFETKLRMVKFIQALLDTIEGDNITKWKQKLQ